MLLRFDIHIRGADRLRNHLGQTDQGELKLWTEMIPVWWLRERNLTDGPTQPRNGMRTLSRRPRDNFLLRRYQGTGHQPNDVDFWRPAEHARDLA